jgi:valyl-tRNA synthetase
VAEARQNGTSRSCAPSAPRRRPRRQVSVLFFRISRGTHLAPTRTLTHASSNLINPDPHTDPTTATPPLTGSASLPKAFDPVTEEPAIYAAWEAGGHFKPSTDADPTITAPPFVMAMPPPNVTGKLHMGHAMFVTLQDIMARVARMRGRPTLWLPGTDHAGIATQMVVEKLLAAEGGPDRLALGRDAFEARVWAWKEEYGGAITDQLRSLGASCDWSRERFTLDTGLSGAVGEAFVRLHEDGLVYRGAYLVNWSPGLRTAVSDLEVEYSEEAGTLYTFRYPVEGGGGGGEEAEFLPVSTTRPETIPGDQAVAVHPGDARFGHLVGRRCIVPLSGGRTIPIIADAAVDPEFGTGALKITPAHDPADYEVGLRLGLPMTNIMADDGTLNASAGPAYAGMDRFKARKAIWRDLEAAGLGMGTAPHTMRVPRSQRGGEVVEPLVREQWFVRMEPLAAPALEAVRSGDVRLVPARFSATYEQWLTNIRDWCVSRQLWWGHRVPVWYVFEGEQAAAASADGRSATYIVARNEGEARAKAEAEHGAGSVLRQETDVLDTWFSSSLWPFSTLGWPAAPADDFARFYPTSTLETGHDILFFWVARMMMMGLRLTGRAPFDTVYLHGLVRDASGRKMSKSLGNVVDPREVSAQAGTDALRHTLATGSAPGQDLNLNPERLATSRNLTNKLWNAGKFVVAALEGGPAASGLDLRDPAVVSSLPLAEAWAVSVAHAAADRVTAAHDRLDFGEAGRAVVNHFWGEFADWYVEAAKTRLYGGDAASAATTRAVLTYTMETVLALAHPVMPFVTERLWGALPGEGGGVSTRPPLISAPWPEPGGPVNEAALAHFTALQGLVGAVRNARAEYGVEPGRKVGGAVLQVRDDATRAAIAGELGVLCALARLDPDTTTVVAGGGATSSEDAASSVVAVFADGLEVILPMAGLFDVDKERARLDKQRSKAAVLAEKAAARLSDPRFACNAPPAVVAEATAAAEEAAQKVAAIDAKIEALGKL